MKRYERYKNSELPWVNDIPLEWVVKPLFSVASENKERNSDGQNETVLSLSYGNIIIKNKDNFGLVPENYLSYQIVKPSSIVLRLTDLQNDKRSLRVGLANNLGIITSAYLNLNLKNDADSRYIYYLLHSYDLHKVFYGLGAGVRQSLSFNDMRRLPIVLPTLEEQQAIVRYLDEKLGQIDTFIHNKRRLIALLEEQKSALINQAVTKGLDEGVEMKDSGVEWLDKIPSHWDALKVSLIAKSLQTGPFGSQLHSEEYVEGKIPVINPSNMKRGRIVPDMSSTIDDETLTMRELTVNILF